MNQIGSGYNVKSNTIKILLALASSIAFVSCTFDSGVGEGAKPQSHNYRHVVDPGSIGGTIIFAPGGLLGAPIHVNIGGSLIEGGGICLNGVSMHEVLAFCGFGFSLSGPPCQKYEYGTWSVPVVANTLYRFIFTLSDKSTFEIIYRLREKALNVFNVPDLHDPQNDLFISWEETAPQYPLRLRATGGPAPQISNAMDLPDSCLSSGSCLIPSSFFDRFRNVVDEVTLCLSSETSTTSDRWTFITHFEITKKLKLVIDG